MHPGGIQTELGRYMTSEVIQQLMDNIAATQAAAGAPQFEWKTVPQGAATSCLGGRGRRVPTRSARHYCEDCHVAPVVDADAEIREGVRGYALDGEHAKALWAKSEELVGETF